MAPPAVATGDQALFREALEHRQDGRIGQLPWNAHPRMHIRSRQGTGVPQGVQDLEFEIPGGGALFTAFGHSDIVLYYTR